MTKVRTHGRSALMALQMLDESLRRLRTDYLDLWQIHGVAFDNDPELATAKGGVVEALDQAKRAGKVRFVGFTGHKGAREHDEPEPSAAVSGMPDASPIAMKRGRPRTTTSLAKYRAKRRFDQTPEPRGGRPKRGAGARFVVQTHDASRLHYDFRLEIDGVLKSWAVPKGPTLDPLQRRLAVAVEDHPLDYFDFEGVIPEGGYGAGEVIVWDWGTFEAADASHDLARGHLKVRLHGKKLEGFFTLVKIKGRGSKDEKSWLLIKADDAAADAKWRAEAHPESVKTGRTLEDLRRPPLPKKRARSPATTPAKKRAAAGARAADPVPRNVHPELATLIDAPFDDPGWLFEVKWDGFRAIATIGADGGVQLTSRNGKDLVARFPSLAAIAGDFTTAPLVVDGEIVALDADGKSSFQLLQHPGRAPIAYIVFDAIYAEGRDLRALALDARKEILARLVRRGAKHVSLSTHVAGTGKKVFAAAREKGLEGVVAKRRDAPYVEKRTRDWVKIKVQQEQECVIGGFTEPGGGRTGFGSLVLGLYERGRLLPCGSVGTGFDGATLASLGRKLRALETARSPFARPPIGRGHARTHWVEPKLVAQVRFTEWTRDGVMRHPAFLGLRDDKEARECHRERARSVAEVA